MTVDHIILILLVISKFLIGTFACVEDLLERVDASEYGYTLFNGPAMWSRKWAQCGGNEQSPIILSTCEMDIKLHKLKFKGHSNYRGNGFRIHNTYQTVEIQYSGDMPYIIGGPLKSNNFTFSQMYFHWGHENSIHSSEHTFRGSSFSLEAHLVHINNKYKNIKEAAKHEDGILVVALLFQSREVDVPELSKVTRMLKYIRQGGSYALIEDDDAMVWLKSYLYDGASYLTYMGSLTTPPCTQSVTWIILENISFIGKKQMNEFRNLEGHIGPILSNRRPFQKLGNRKIKCTKNYDW